MAVKNSIKVGPLVFMLLNACNHGEHYETPCICLSVYVYTNLSDITLNFPTVFSNFRSSLPIQGDLYRAGKMRSRVQ